MINCPRCRAPMAEIDYEGITVDTCRSCGGEWLDPDELKAVTARRETVFTPEEIAQVEGVDQVTVVAQDELAEELSCPRCGARLRAFNYAYTSGVIIDKCPDCGGIWLDKDELEHVQILAEEWAGRMEADQQKYGSVLRKIRQRQDALDQVSVSRFGVVNALLTGMLRVID